MTMQRSAALRVSGLALGAAMALGGCQSVGTMAARSLMNAIDEDPYSYEVEAKQLTNAPQQTAPLPEAEKAEQAAASAQAAAPAEPAAAAERTNIRGQGDGSMEVDVVRVQGARDNIPHRVPDFSREQVATMVCNSRTRDVGVRRSGVEAWRATNTAHDAHESYLDGRMPARQYAPIERRRQDALIRHVGPNLQYGLFGRLKKDDLPRPQSANGVALENVDLFFFTENGAEVMAVSGVAHNTTAVAAEVPPVTLQAIDGWDFILAGQTSLLPFETLQPGESRPFEVRFLNPPDTTDEVYAHFAPPFEYRASRDCDDFDPEHYDPAAAFEPQPEPTGPLHTSGELSLITRIYRNQAEAAWNCREGENTPSPDGGLRIESFGSGERREGIGISIGRPNMALQCAGFRHHERWRPQFEMAEAADEAWGSAVALEAAERRMGGNQAAKGAFDAAGAAETTAVARMRALADRSLVRDGAPAQDVNVVVASATYAYGGWEVGRTLELSGTMTNTGAETRHVKELMLVLVDRLELPLWSMSVDVDETLAPGETRPITQRIRLTRDPVHNITVERPPGWRLRVGAVG
jgi:hypothetical protein